MRFRIQQFRCGRSRVDRFHANRFRVDRFRVVRYGVVRYGVVRYGVVLAALIALLASATTTFAEDTAAEPAAIRVTRRAVEKWAALIASGQQQAAASAAQATAAQASLDEAKAIVATADATIAAANDTIKSATAAKDAADQALAAAQTAALQIEAGNPGDVAAATEAANNVVAAAKASADSSTKLADAVAAKSVAFASRKEAEAKIASLEAALKSATEARTAADAAVAASTRQHAESLARLNAFVASPPKADPKLIRKVATLAHDRGVLDCRYDADGDFVYVGLQGNSPVRWDRFTGSKVEFAGHQSWVSKVVPLPTPGQFLTAGYDGKIGVWDANNAAQPFVRMIDAHAGFVRCIAVTRDGTKVVSGGNDNLVKVWSLADGGLLHTLSGHAAHVYGLIVHPGEPWVYSGDLAGVLKQWDINTGAHVRDLDASQLHKYDEGFRAHVGGVRAMDFSPDGKTLLAVGVGKVTNAFAGVGDPTLLQFDVDTGALQKTVIVPGQNQGAFWGVRYHPSGEFVMLAAWGNPGKLWFWKQDEDQPFHSFNMPSNAYDCDFHPDGLQVIVGLHDRTVMLLDLGPQIEMQTAAK